MSSRRGGPDLEPEVEPPDLWSDPDHARAVTTAYGRVRADVEMLQGLTAQLDDADALYEIAEAEGAEADVSVAGDLAGRSPDSAAPSTSSSCAACSPASTTTATRSARSTPARAAPTRRTGPR